MAAKPVTVEERLRDIVKWGTSLSRHIQGMTQEQFLTDEKTQHAATKCIESIGEAAKEILKGEPNFDSRHPNLRLKAAARMRDRLTHGYREIDLQIVWTTSTTSVPATTEAAEIVLAEISSLKPNNDGDDGTGGGASGGPPV